LLLFIKTAVAVVCGGEISDLERETTAREVFCCCSNNSSIQKKNLKKKIVVEFQF
jgi:hypothetical protein